MIRLSTLAYSTRLLSYTFLLSNHYFSPSPFTKILVKCRQVTASDLLFYDIFALQKVPFLKITDDIIACDLWFGSPPIENPGYAYGLRIPTNELTLAHSMDRKTI